MAPVDCIRATRRSIRSTKKPAALCKLSFTRGYYPNSYTDSIYLCETYGFHERDARRARSLRILFTRLVPFHRLLYPCFFRSTTAASFRYPFKCIILFLLLIIIIIIKEKEIEQTNKRYERERNLGMGWDDIILLTNIHDK